LREISIHVYEVRPRKDHCGVDLISDALPFGRPWYGEPNAISNAIGYAQHRSPSFCFFRQMIIADPIIASNQPSLVSENIPCGLRLRCYE